MSDFVIVWGILTKYIVTDVIGDYWKQEAQLPQRNSASAVHVYLGWLTDRAMNRTPRHQMAHVGVSPGAEASSYSAVKLEEFQPMWSRYLNVTDRRTDGRTDGRTLYDRNTALCTKVHRAVKTSNFLQCHHLFPYTDLLLYTQCHKCPLPTFQSSESYP